MRSKVRCDVPAEAATPASWRASTPLEHAPGVPECTVVVGVGAVVVVTSAEDVVTFVVVVVAAWRWWRVLEVDPFRRAAAGCDDEQAARAVPATSAAARTPAPRRGTRHGQAPARRADGERRGATA